jgi:Short repeat of unknown function (DUF308)
MAAYKGQHAKNLYPHVSPRGNSFCARLRLHWFLQGGLDLIMQRTPDWLWLMEIIRGAFAIAFGLLLVLAFSFTTRVVLSLLGVYLLMDGCLDVYNVATGRRYARRKARAYLAAATSILVGLISLVLPLVTILLLALIIAIRIVMRGVRVLGDARRSRSTYLGTARSPCGYRGCRGTLDSQRFPTSMVAVPDHTRPRPRVGRPARPAPAPQC